MNTTEKRGVFYVQFYYRGYSCRSHFPCPQEGHNESEGNAEKWVSG